MLFNRFFHSFVFLALSSLFCLLLSNHATANHRPFHFDNTCFGHSCVGSFSHFCVAYTSLSFIIIFCCRKLPTRCRRLLKKWLPHSSKPEDRISPLEAESAPSLTEWSTSTHLSQEGTLARLFKPPATERQREKRSESFFM